MIIKRTHEKKPVDTTIQEPNNGQEELLLMSEDVASLKLRQDETENTVMFILDMTLGGM